MRAVGGSQVFFFFFSSRRRHTRFDCDWSSDVCSSDLVLSLGVQRGAPAAEICREVRGVVLSRQPVALGQWVQELARALMVHAEENAAAEIGRASCRERV